jgi:hypothetical protein
LAAVLVLVLVLPPLPLLLLLLPQAATNSESATTRAVANVVLEPIERTFSSSTSHQDSRRAPHEPARAGSSGATVSPPDAQR